MIAVSTFDVTLAQLAAFGANRSDLATTPVEFLGELIGVEAQLAQNLMETAAGASADFVPSVETSTEGLDAWAVAVGLPNGAGGLGRRGATAASGLTATLTGAPGETIPSGQAGLSGGARFVLTATVTLPGTLGAPGTAQASGSFSADSSDPSSLGAVGNLLPGARILLVSPPANVDSVATVTSGPTTPGKAQEQDDALLVRLQEKMQRPPNGGNAGDYKGWVEANIGIDGALILSSGSLTCYAYPGYFGTLSPLLVVTQSGTGTGRKVDSTALGKLRLVVNGDPAAGAAGKRPIGQDARVYTPYMPADRALQINLQYLPATVKFRPDWSRGGVGLTVSSFAIAGLPVWATAAGANAVIELNQLAPASLKNAVSNGAAPRIFGNWKSGSTFLGPIVPKQVQVLAWNDTGAKTSIGILLEAPETPAAWVALVQANNAIYPGGPAVDAICASVLALVDSLGPSRLSGLADPAQYWPDTLGITAIATAAANTLAPDGVTRMVDRCVANSVSIDVGGATFTTDLQAYDNTIDGPECLFVGRVVAADG